MSEEEIKKCKIKINNKLIPFNYFYKFESEGKYIIKYFFKIYLTKTNYLFSSCDSLIKLDLSNFNKQIVTNMHCIFAQCKSLLYKFIKFLYEQSHRYGMDVLVL